jgi:hypothetical protein
MPSIGCVNLLDTSADSFRAKLMQVNLSAAIIFVIVTVIMLCDVARRITAPLDHCSQAIGTPRIYWSVNDRLLPGFFD